MLGYRPLVYFWIAEYTDGTELPQFGPETGKENRFADVNQSKLKRFGWYPFSLELSQKIYKNSGLLVAPLVIPPYVIELKEGQKLIVHRTNTIKLHMKSGGIEHAETIYVLGVEGGKIIQINENGETIRAV